MYDGNFQFLQASDAFTNYPTQKNIQYKELADGNNDEISRKKASRDLAAAKTMSIKSTVAGAVAAVASWKMLTQENLEVESAGIASRY
jgi:hypothetical protein